MQRRVIELSAGEVVRDERSAGYAITAEAIALEVEATDAAAATPAVAAVASGAAKTGAAKTGAATKAPRKGASRKPAARKTASAPAAGVAASAGAAAVVAAVADDAHVNAAREATEVVTTPGEIPASGEDAAAVVAAIRSEESVESEGASEGEPPAGTITAAAPKVTPEVMRDAPPLYVEPEATDAVTDEAAAITAAATAPVGRLPAHTDEAARAAASADADASAADDGPPGRPAPPASAKKSANLTLAERLGLRSPAGPRPGDDDQEVGPVK
jgi:cell division transport system ATP-binding protein